MVPKMDDKNIETRDFLIFMKLATDPCEAAL